MENLDLILEKNLPIDKKGRRENYIGEYIGMYLNAKPEIMYKCKRTLGFVTVGNYSYIKEMGLSSLNTTLSKINFFPSKKRRSHASTRNFLKEKGITMKVNDVFIPGEHFIYRSPVYKPYIPEEINEKDFQGPFTQSKNPLIEKIIYRGKKIYFAIINKKLTIYSINYENGKKKMVLYSSGKIDEEQNNAEFLKIVANDGLNRLIKIEKEKIKENYERMKPAYQINWPDFKNLPT